MLMIGVSKSALLGSRGCFLWGWERQNARISRPVRRLLPLSARALRILRGERICHRLSA